jgi:hypothetical protein
VDQGKPVGIGRAGAAHHRNRFSPSQAPTRRRGRSSTNLRDRCHRPRRRSPGSTRTCDARSRDRPLTSRTGRPARGCRADRRSMRGNDGASLGWECRAARRRGGAKASVGPDLRHSDADSRGSRSRRRGSRLRRQGCRHGVDRSGRRLRRLGGSPDLRMRMSCGRPRRTGRAALRRLRHRARTRRRPARVRHSAHRKQRLGVHVALLVGRDAHAEVDVRLRPVGLAARAHGGHGRPLGDRITPANPNRAEMLQRHRVPVRGTDRERHAALRHRACKRHRAGRRSPHVRAQIARDVDAAMLTACIRIAPEDKRTEHSPVDRPRPGLG